MHDYDHLLSTIPAICLGHRTRITARALSRLYQRFFRGIALTGSQFGILVTLAAKPDQTIAALGREVGMEATTVVRAVQQLERRGLVRTAGGAGRQAKRSALTAAGRRLLIRAVPRWQAAHGAMVEALGGDGAARSALRAIARLERSAGALLAEPAPASASGSASRSARPAAARRAPVRRTSARVSAPARPEPRTAARTRR